MSGISDYSGSHANCRISKGFSFIIVLFVIAPALVFRVLVAMLLGLQPRDVGLVIKQISFISIVFSITSVFLFGFLDAMLLS
ncbi:hypothetical protein R6Q59_003638 [Mikania micrantha]